MNEAKVWMRGMGVRFQEDRREWILPDFLYSDDLLLCNKSEEDLG